MNRNLDQLAPGLPGTLQLVYDLGLVVVAAFLAVKGPVSWDSTLWWMSGASIVMWVIGSTLVRLYSPFTQRTATDYLSLLLLVIAAVGFGLFIVERIFLADVGRFSVTSFVVIFFTWTLVGRSLFFEPLRRVAGIATDILIVGVGPAAVALVEIFRQRAKTPTRVIGHLAFEGEIVHRSVMAPVLGRAEDLLDVLAEHPVDEVFITGKPLVRAHQMQQVVRAAELVGVPFALPMHALTFERARLLTHSGSDDGYLHYISTDTRPGQYAIKRLVDIALSGSALLALSPLLVAVALAVKLTSKGPVFFKQQRVGLQGQLFHMLKFRSMVIDADEMKEKLSHLNERSGPVFKIQNDPRITRIGRFIRRYSIDELPQFINILRGDMAIVGPRPAVPKEVAQYKVWQRRRLSVRPGLTCYWQVSGRNEIGFNEWMELDLRYVDNWSIREDIKLMFQTVPVVLTGRGAS